MYFYMSAERRILPKKDKRLPYVGWGDFFLLGISIWIHIYIHVCIHSYKYFYILFIFECNVEESGRSVGMICRHQMM